MSLFNFVWTDLVAMLMESPRECTGSLVLGDIVVRERMSSEDELRG